MKHETFNSILGALGLSIAAFTAWHQFAPARDSLELVVEDRIDIGQRQEVVAAGLSPLFNGVPMSAIGPVSWKVRIYNKSERTISVVKYSIFLLIEGERKVKYSAMNQKLLPYDIPLNGGNLVYQKLPDNIDSKKAKAYILSLNVPFADEFNEEQCKDNNPFLHDLEYCLFSKGRDLFGNPVSIGYFDRSSDVYTVALNSRTVDPEFIIIIETADGSKFEANFSYYSQF